MEDYFLNQNRLLEDRVDLLIHSIETRLDKLFSYQEDTQTSSQQHDDSNSITGGPSRAPYSASSFLTFKAPYIRDFRGWCAPTSADTKQIKQLNGNENIDLLIKTKLWSKEAKQQLNEAVQDHYAQKHLVKLLKQKNQLIDLSASTNNVEDIGQKLRLLEEQAEQVRRRKNPKIFLPEDRFDTEIDWCSISAKLTSHHDAHDCRLMWTNELHWSISDNLWTKDEDICLINAVAKHGKSDWDSVARELNSNRLAWQCCSRYNQNYAFEPSTLDQGDSDKIIEVINLCRFGNFVPWDQVMYFIQSHSLHQVKYQWHKYCAEASNSSPWTHNEDALLMAAVRKFGEKSWSRVADLIPGRHNKSCRERYIMRLKYKRRAVGRWRPAEDLKLLQLIDMYGTNWSIVSAHLPERNAHQLRNRYELIRNQPERKNRCPISHRKLYRKPTGELVKFGYRRAKAEDQRDVDRRLAEIFSTYREVNPKKKAKCVYRSAQDEIIYQTLVRVLCDTLSDQEQEHQLLGTIIKKAICYKQGLLPPSHSTMIGYKALTLQQDYLDRLASKADGNQDDQPEIDEKILKIFVSIFLWPAVLSRLKCPQVDLSKCQVGSIIEKNAKNLYKIRNIQNLLTK